MPVDLGGLIRRDHDELDRILVALVRSERFADETTVLVESLQIGLAAHAGAERAVLSVLLGPVASSRVVADAVRNLLDEHRRQSNMVAALASLRPGSSGWSDCLLELRIAILDHAAREEFVGATLLDQLAPERRGALAADYATQRLQRFAYLDIVPTYQTQTLAFN